MPSDKDRRYIVGETVILTATVSEPNTRKPIDADAVVLDAVILNNIAYVAASTDINEPFGHLSLGYYEFRVQTAGWEAGTYTWRAKITDGQGGVALKEDTFVLVAPS